MVMNGWQRFWIVGSVPWVAIVAVAAIVIAPDFSSSPPTEVYDAGPEVDMPEERDTRLNPDETYRIFFQGQ
jgi:hypothetical protein